jgi:hypothetical protein
MTNACDAYAPPSGGIPVHRPVCNICRVWPNEIKINRPLSAFGFSSSLLKLSPLNLQIIDRHGGACIRTGRL